MNKLTFISTALSLGVHNLLRVMYYRIGVKTGLNPVQKIAAQMPSGSFFAHTQKQETVFEPSYQLTAFGWKSYAIGQYPNWFYSPLTGANFANTAKSWFEIPDFDANVGDIKGIWEASRFDWLLHFVLRHHETHDQAELAQLDQWLNNWCENNSAYLGPNWKCGQEASIRVMHLISALIGLEQWESPSQNVLALIEIHLKRIAPTIDYAIAQDNNHGTSEAAALFIGGSLLNSVNQTKLYSTWQSLGRKWLENRASKLIMADGGFSQYSVNYHRVMLDSYCLSEIIRRKLKLPEFSASMYSQLHKAADWLFVLTQENGDVPNLGANDGAKLLPVSKTDYRDFRPSVQLASTLFAGQSYYTEAGSYDQPLTFFGLDKIHQTAFVSPNKNKFFKSSGLISAEHNNFFIAFKLPVFKFRPSQCDALHLDVWCNGQNTLRDGGTYSYNSTADDLDYFSGPASHNTVQFDGHLQMPRLSRFLFGAWLKPLNLAYSEDKFSCGYADFWGCQHQRQVSLHHKEIIVIDSVLGFKESAVLRWRLQPGSWELNGGTLSNGRISIEIKANTEAEITLSSGFESRYYYQKTVLPVLEVKVKHSSTITTVIKEIS
ncbi:MULTISPECIES: heparinase II/III family protein [unclassified Acinetobacter]|uniref:heparinase II/III domain-containing protein n=1 Tax=unclassified Acinetobacter TaxID=196816 RepID=UPI0015D32889|nr:MULTISPECIES: heparinase II/III family protein [unclassified Acinetobacter]UUS65269.1 heparinase II/III family protein [Acinetobacter sp. YH12068_T]